MAKKPPKVLRRFTLISINNINILTKYYGKMVNELTFL